MSTTQKSGIDVLKEGLLEEPSKDKEKRCSKCKKTKPLTTGFYKASHSADGYHWRCKECCKEADRQRRQKKMNAMKGKETTAGLEKPESHAEGALLEFNPIEGRVMMCIDFTDYPDLLEVVETKAKKSFRTPESQILFWIAQYGQTTI